MTDEKRIEAARRRYERAAHAMQSGVAMELNPRDQTTKHLRVGVNAAMSDAGGLATLLIAKGVFTEAEYVEAMADAMEREAATYEKRLSEHYGKPVTLA